MPKWGFLTNHALVLFHVFQHPRSTLREIADSIQITERAALSCLRQMEAEELVSRTKEGRRNRYTVNVAAVLAHQTRGAYTIEQIATTVVDVAEELRRLEEADAQRTAEQVRAGRAGAKPRQRM